MLGRVSTSYAPLNRKSMVISIAGVALTANMASAGASQTSSREGLATPSVALNPPRRPNMNAINHP